jgi:hypothetical protein
MDQQQPQLGSDLACNEANKILTQLTSLDSNSNSNNENLNPIVQTKMDVNYLLQEIMSINNLKLDPARENMYILEK